VKKQPALNAFDRPTKDEWLRRIEKDLKGQPLSSLDLSFGGVKFPRFVHHSDQTQTYESLNSRRGVNEWAIAATMHIKNPKEDNVVLLEELKGGAQELWLHCEQVLSKSELADLFKGIDLTIIGVHWSPASQTFGRELIVNWRTFIADKGPVRWSWTVDGSKAMDDWQKEIPVVGLSGSEDLANRASCVVAMAAFMGRMLDVLGVFSRKENGKRQLKAVRLVVPVGSNMLWEVAKLRALRIVLNNIRACFELEVEIYIEAVTARDVLEMELTDHLIAQQPVCLAAVTGGATSVCLPIAEQTPGEKSEFYRRIVRNTHHLLKVEGQLGQVIDPAAGSYFFEQLTSELAGKCWAELVSKYEQV
jgi:methylmalonyl-CoA mutase